MSRPGFKSRPEIPHAPDVYEILERHDDAIREHSGELKDLKALAQKGELADAQILTKLTNIEATDRHATTKLIGGFVITIVTTLAGVIGTIVATRTNPDHAPVAIPRSSLDVALDRCRAMQPSSAAREECTRLAVEAHP